MDKCLKRKGKSININYFLIFSLMAFVFISHAKPSFLRHKNINERQTTMNLQTNTFPASKTCNIKQPPGFQFKLHSKEVCAYMTVGTLVDKLSPKYNFNLKLQYHCNNFAMKYGTHWSWNITHLFFMPWERNKTGVLFTSQGQCFSLSHPFSRWIWRPCNIQAKTKNIKIEGNNPFNHLTITYADGTQETLNQEGYETRLKQSNGRVIYFAYSGYNLSMIKDNQGHKIISKSANQGYTNDISSYDNGRKILHTQLPWLGVILYDRNDTITATMSIDFYPKSWRVQKIVYPNPYFHLTESLAYSCDKGDSSIGGNICEINKIILSKPECSNTTIIG